jgi:hypothetical protein
MNSNKLIHEERKSRIATGNRCFYSLRRILRFSAMSKTVKIKMYKMLMTSVVVSRCETWALTEMDMKRLSKWVKKIVRVASMVKQGIWRIRIRRELKEIYKNVDIVADTKKKRLEWIGHVAKIDQTWTVKKVF